MIWVPYIRHRYCDKPQIRMFLHVPLKLVSRTRTPTKLIFSDTSITSKLRIRMFIVITSVIRTRNTKTLTYRYQLQEVPTKSFVLTKIPSYIRTPKNRYVMDVFNPIECREAE